MDDGQGRAVALGLILASMASVQLGAAVATTLFEEVGSVAAVTLRLALAIPIMVALWPPPRPLAGAGRDLVVPVLLGLALAAMNTAFYASIDRIPLGIAVTLEFLGPLAVAVLAAHRRLALLWAALAAAGVLALVEPGGGSLDALGVALALVAAACWALYILLTERVGRLFSGGSGLTIAVLIGGVVMIPPGIATAGADLLSAHVLAVGVAVALLACVITYSAELEALRRIPPGVFGILMSLEPGVAALVGLVALGQGLDARELVGIACVVVASAGAIRTGRPPPPLPG